MNKIIKTTKLILLVFILVTSSKISYSQVVKPFGIKYQTTQKGGIVYLANVVAGCSSNPATSGGSCQTNATAVPPGGTGINNNFNQVYVDIDGDGTTFQSSSDSLVLPNCSNITWAGLFWGAMGNASNCPTRNNIKLKVNNGSYQNIRADDSMLNTAGYNSYHSFKNITSIVQAAGIRSKFTLANIPFINNGNSNNWGSWQIVVVYGNQLLGMRQLTVFNGLANISGSSTVNVPISGFLTPPTGPVKFELGTYVHDGDRSFTGDQMQFSGGGGPFINVTDALNPSSDVFNSTVSDKGVLTNKRNPNLNNTMGLDADIFEPNNTSKNYLGNAKTNAVLKLTTGGETYLVQEISTAIDVFEPDLRVDKKVFDRLGNNVYNATVNPGDTLTYRVTVYNIGSDTAVNTFVTDSIRREAMFVPSSIRYIYGPNSGTKTDGASDDQAEYNPLTLKFKFRVGTGATSAVGGRVLNSSSGSDSTVLSYKVVAVDDCMILKCNNLIANSSLVTSTGKISGNTLSVGSNPAAFDVSGCPISGTTNTFINVSLLSCVFPPDTTIASLCPAFESLASLYTRPGYSRFYNSSFNEVITAVFPGTYYAFRTGPTGCIDTVNINVLATACDPPNIGIDCGTILVNTAKTGNMGTNNYFPLGYTATNFITIPVKNASNGTFAINTAGSYTYTPNLNFTGKDTMVVSYCGSPLIPGPSLCMNDTLFVNTIPAITVVSNNFTTNNNVLVTGNLNTNNSHPNSTLISTDIIPIKNADNGVFNVLADGTFDYTPNPGFSGRDTMIVNSCATIIVSSCLIDTIVSCKNDTLVVLVLQTSITNVSVCEPTLPYIWNGNSYNAEGTYTVHLLSVGGFDSIAVLNLSINPAPFANFNINNPIQCANDLFTFTNASTNKKQSTWEVTDIGSTPLTIDNNAVELGVKFKADVNGVISGIRFFKLAASTGTFVGKLYTSSGTLLATANFITSDSGWQQVLFTTPVSITANTTYVATYYAPNGRYAFDANYFATSAKMNGNLKALKDGEDGANGVFVYGGGGGFPMSSFNSANYWVDVVFSADGALNYNWDFGDATTSTATNENKTYATTGSFNVKLVVTNAFGCKDSITKPVYTNNPVAAFTYTNKCNGVIQFNNTSTNANNFEWRFSNGRSYCTTSLDSFNFTFSAGTQTVTLIANYNGSCSDTITQTITILPSPLAIFAAYPIGCTREVRFNNVSIGGSEYHWDFGVPIILNDTSNLLKPTYVYPADGTYNVKLKVTSLEGCVDSFNTNVVVNSIGILPTASFSINNMSGNCVNRYSFINTSTNAATYQWIFSDGTSVIDTNTEKSFGAAGTYQVMLVARSATNCYDTIVQTVNALTGSTGPIALFVANSNQTCLRNNSFEFNNTSYYMGSGWIPQYEWDFGDGTTNNVNTYIYGKHYNLPGIYSVRLIATGSNGCKDTAYQSVEVLPGPSALFTAFMNCGMTADITNTSTNAIGYMWDYGDNTSSNTSSLAYTHTYALQNWYNITLTAIGANGCVDYASRTIVASMGQIPVPLFTYDTIACSNAIRFRNLSSTTSEYSWNFGDGSPILWATNPTKAYAVAGDYTVTLTASNGNDCFATYTLLVHAPAGQNIALPKAAFTHSVGACNNEITANDTSTNVASRIWYFDGIQVGTAPWLNITNPAAGYHELKLVVSNGNCVDSISKFILIQPSPSGIFNHTSSTCTRTVLFTTNTLNGNYFKWKFNDVLAIVDTAIGNIVSHTFTNNGTYIVQLDITNLTGCTTSVFDTIIVNASNNPLNAAFYSNSTNCNCICTNKIKFINTSSGAGNQYLWNFGDGNTSTQANPNKGYGATGFYNVSLTVTNPAGCMSVASSQVYIPANSKGASASFSVDNPIQCLTANNFNFNNTSTYMGNGGYVSKYYWDFGDGTIDSTNTFVFNKHYNAVGVYTVSLVAVGSDNCKDTMTITVQVKATNCLIYSNNVQIFNQANNATPLFASINTNTGITEKGIKSNTWNLYPNPNSGSFTLSSLNLSNNVSLEIFDILGRKINATILYNYTDNKIEINCAGISNGNYFVAIKNSKTGETSRLKFNITQ
jgi:uncharacterized repeat protein (TIGR01451 family)